MISAGEIAAFNQALLPQRMSVYAEDPATTALGGRFTVLDASDIRCRRIDPAAAGLGYRVAERASYQDPDRLNYEATYTLPAEPCQIEIDGVRFQIVAGSVRDRLGPMGEVLVRTALVTPVSL